MCTLGARGLVQWRSPGGADRRSEMCTLAARGPVQWRSPGGTDRRSERVKLACDAAMTRTTGRGPNKIINYWWNSEMADLRKKSNKARRIMTRVRKRYPEAYPLKREKYRVARKRLNRAIRIAKDEVYNRFCEELKENIWDDLINL